MWPTVQVKIDDGLNVHVTIAGVTRVSRAQTLAEARGLALSQIGAWARHFGRDISVTVTDPEGTWQIDVDPHGIAIDTTETTKNRWWMKEGKRRA